MTMMNNVIAFETRPAQPRLRRPKLLVRAARAGLPGWRRQRDLQKLLKSDELPPTGKVLPRLYAEERRLDLARRENDAEYDLHRHIMVLIAILAETAKAAPGAVPVALTYL